MPTPLLTPREFGVVFGLAAGWSWLGDFDFVLTARLEGLSELGMLLTRLNAPLSGEILVAAGASARWAEEDLESMEEAEEENGMEEEDMFVEHEMVNATECYCWMVNSTLSSSAPSIM